MTLSQLWPPVADPSTLSRQVWDADTALALPGVGRAVKLYEALLGQCELDDVAGIHPRPRSRLLDRPDPARSRPSFVKSHVRDYLVHGNAAHLVTAWDSYGYPAAARWYPAHEWGVVDDDGEAAYYLRGQRVDSRLVVHSRRGQDPTNPHRGVGVVEQHVRALNRAGLQEAAESETLRGRGVPSVAIITPQKEPNEDDLTAAADKWVERFNGPEPRPGFFPAGTSIVPLSWTPSDQQLVEARKLSLTDVANAFNLDGYWIGAPASSHTYRTPGAMYLVLLRTSLNEVAVELEDDWSDKWLPRGRRVRLNRTELLRDDLETTVRTMAQAVQSDLYTLEEARTYLQLDPSVVPDNGLGPAAAPAPPPEPPADDPEPTQEETS